MFTERKITQFQHPVADLADTPALSAAELKARFDACPEELRAALNGVCDDGAVLEERINAYRAQTFAGEITESMLDTPLTAKINGKADQSALETAQTGLSEAIAAKCTLICGSYTGNGAASQTIELGVQPKAVFVYPVDSQYLGYTYYYSGLALPGSPVELTVSSTVYPVLQVTETGFTVYYNKDRNILLNSGYNNFKFHYLAFV
ncbi:MAG: hypothetical protein J6L72_04250 [Butyricicoccus sp.]|nr:hypothetical protein [Butyricicoccus sp.]